MKVKYGAMVVNGAGKLGGHQFQRGRDTGHWVTKRTGRRRADRRPSRQNRLFREACSSWQSETPEYKKEFTETWDDGVEVPAKFGDVVGLTGFQVYLMRYITYALGNLPFNSTIIPPRMITGWKSDASNNPPSVSSLALAVRFIAYEGPALPLVYIKGFNRGQQQPNGRKKTWIVRDTAQSDGPTLLYRFRDNPNLKRESRKDFLKIWIYNWDEIGDRVIEDSVVVST